ncbi:MAG: TonB-dependent receptor [Magnetococcales bacterium]|nr:TonB-dependent receptor [Magnetococcales bacterium]
MTGPSRKNRILWLVWLVGMSLSWRANAAETPPSSGDDSEQAAYRELMAVMADASSIATKTRLNADFVPGMVTVMHGKDLAAKGVRDVLEALNMVPGFHGGIGELIVRGVSKWGSGKVKILLNSTPVDHALTARVLPALYLPIHAVERIEVMRGPGSAVHGENAFLGVVNIITYSNNNQLVVGVGDHAALLGVGAYAARDPKTGLGMHLQVGGVTDPGERVGSGPDILHSPAINQPAISHAPGDVMQGQRQRFGVLTLDYRKWSLEARYLDYATTDWFGTAGALPPPDDRMIWDHGEWGIRLQNQADPTADLHLTTRFGWSEHEMGFDKLNFFPPGLITPNPSGGWYFHPQGVVGSSYAREERLDGGVEMLWSGLARHRLLMGLDLARIQLADVWTEINVDFPASLAQTNWHRLDDDHAWIKSGVHRRMTGIMLQDQYAATDHLDLIAGARLDHYDDVGSAFAPRIGLVYRLTDRHILKGQFGQAFRPPTLFEMYANNFVISGNPEIKPEKIDTYEIGYIYRDTSRLWRVTWFHSRLKEMIAADNSTGKFKNGDGARLRGMEVEWEEAIDTLWKIDASVSFVDARDMATGRQIEQSANWLGHAGLTWEPWPDYGMAVRYRLVGPRNRAVDDIRPKLAQSHFVDVTGSRHRLLDRKWTVTAAIRNLFDVRQIEPANSTYPEDLPLAGRTWSLLFHYEYK